MGYVTTTCFRCVASGQFSPSPNKAVSHAWENGFYRPFSTSHWIAHHSRTRERTFVVLLTALPMAIYVFYQVLAYIREGDWRLVSAVYGFSRSLLKDSTVKLKPSFLRCQLIRHGLQTRSRYHRLRCRSQRRVDQACYLPRWQRHFQRGCKLIELNKHLFTLTDNSNSAVSSSPSVMTCSPTSSKGSAVKPFTSPSV